MGVALTPRSPRLIVALSLTAVLFGCERYAVTLNQQPVYTPPPLFSDFSIADKALSDCIKQTIVDKKVVKAEQLISLTCRHAGVTSLQGLQQFPALQELDVSFNQLQSAAPLAKLAQLTRLKIDNNPALECASLTQLKQAELEITPPAHCLAQ